MPGGSVLTRQSSRVVEVHRQRRDESDKIKDFGGVILRAVVQVEYLGAVGKLVDDGGDLSELQRGPADNALGEC